MFGLFRKKGEDAPAPAPSVTEPATEGMHWLAETSLPIPDWAAMHWPQDTASDVLDSLANGQAAAWLDAMDLALGGHYHRRESEDFMLLSSLEPRPANALLEYLQRSLRRVLATLPGIAANEGHGKFVVLVWDDEETYYRYVAHYGPGGNEPEAFSSGMFIDSGYGHFVFPKGPFEQMEPVVVHELTHCLVRHLPIPAWLNEGLAVNTEHRFTHQRPRYEPREREHLFGRFWNADTIQEFWSGKSFLRPDDGQPLSYELAKILVQLLDGDYDQLAAYCARAQREDGGEAAAGELLGASLGQLAAVVLGEGDWRPRPHQWRSGTEAGQFRP